MVERDIVLVGLPGVGKTSVGRRLAKELQRPFADADEQLELRAGRTIPQIFRDEGEDAFRRLETEVLEDLLGRPRPLVIAAGGGAVERKANQELLRKHAVVVWLRASPAFLAERTDPAHRPLLAADPAGALARLEARRTPQYADVADLVVDIEPFHGRDEKPKRAVARHIIVLLGGDQVGGDQATGADDPGQP
jgi:shikimate kinase